MIEVKDLKKGFDGKAVISGVSASFRNRKMQSHHRFQRKRQNSIDEMSCRII